MPTSLKDHHIAILVVDGFEQAELQSPREALQAAGARTAIVSSEKKPVQGMHHDQKGDTFEVDLTWSQADPADFTGVLLPGGVVNADEIRMDARAQAFVRSIDKSGKPLAVICHGPWLLISAELARGRTLTSWPSLKDDLKNAGANWLDQEVVRDGNWVSSRKPDDLPAFNQAFIALLAGQS
ncbi:type 1 glutamine amidotransferase domain-containing protein [Orrella sp. JC864]|uniref:type 1 glutamine amidotransferase domain-containing protein n=1 Tax=Orrella sp. JC864 TaxID=3120298 RepID=UPI0012BC3884